MEWWLALIIILGGLIALLIIGIPVYIAFAFICVLGTFFFWGGAAGLRQFSLSLYDSLASFTLLPFPLFIFLGSVLFRGGIASRTIGVASSLITKVPGRLNIIAIAAGALLAAMTGSSMASAVMLGKMLVPDMEKLGYDRSLALGAILGGGCLAILIPPSGLCILVAAVARVDVGRLLLSGIMPGVAMAAGYVIYIMVRCKLNPTLAPAGKVISVSLSEKLKGIGQCIVPLAVVIVAVIGLIMFGVATPSESAALGCVAALIIAACYGTLKWRMLKESLLETIMVSSMLFAIIMGATAFGQVLAFSGATAGIVKVFTSIPVSPVGLVLLMQLIVLILCCFMDQVAVLMVSLPVFMPVVQAAGINDFWFVALLFVNCMIGTVTPPFGMTLFVMKGVSPPGTTSSQIYKGVAAFVAIDIIVLVLCIFFPPLILWLPG